MNHIIDTRSVPSPSCDTALQQLAAALRPWPGRSIVQEYERRHPAEDLRRTAAELVLSLELSLEHLKRVVRNCGYHELIEEIEAAVSQIGHEIRAISAEPVSS